MHTQIHPDTLNSWNNILPFTATIQPAFHTFFKQVFRSQISYGVVQLLKKN